MKPLETRHRIKAPENTTFLALSFVLAVLSGCGEQESVVAEPEAETAASSELAAPQITDVRQILDEIQPAIPLWPGARVETEAIQQVGETAIIELRTDDPFPMVWHYYVLYLAQYRAWDPLDPFPPSGEARRTLDLNLSVVMQDPFIPGTEIRRDDVVVRLTIQEEEPPEHATIRYVISPAH